jgi:hypothetical protein
MGESSGTMPWGFTCIVMRNVAAGGNPIFFSSTSVSTQAQNANILSYPRSLILENVVDASANDGSSRSWITLDGQTPTAANGQELTYQYIPSNFTVGTAYYLPSGSGQKSFGVAFGGNMTYKTLFTLIPGDDAPNYLSAALGTYNTGTTKSLSTSIPTDATYMLAAVYVGVPPGSGTDSAITTTLTWAGKACTSVAKLHSNNGTQGYVEVYQLISPPTGTNTLLATASASVDIDFAITSFVSVELSNPIKAIQTATGNSSTASVTISGLDVRNTIFAAVIAGNTISSPNVSGNAKSITNFRQLYNTNSDGGAAGFSITGTPDTSQTISHSVTSAAWGMISIVLNPASSFPAQAIYGFSA